MQKVFSENPENDLWRELLQYTYEANIKRYFTKKGYAESTSKVIDCITGAFLQAHEYYELSKTANLHISPLILYYGSTNLLYGMSHLIAGEEVEVNNHGMKIFIPERWNFIADMEVNFFSPRDGGIHIFSKSLGFEYDLTQYGKWTLKEFLDSIAEISDDFVSCYEVPYGKTVLLDVFETPEGEIEKIYYTKETEVALQNLINAVERFQQSYLNPRRGRELSGGREYYILRHKINGVKINDITYSGQPYLCASHEKNGKKISLPRIINMYVGLFILASLCRYYPEIWGPFVIKDSTGEKLLIEKFLFYCRRMIPNMVLNRINGNDIQYISDKYHATNTVKLIGEHEVKDLIGKEISKQLDAAHILQLSER